MWYLVIACIVIGMEITGIPIKVLLGIFTFSGWTVLKKTDGMQGLKFSTGIYPTDKD